MTCQPCIDAMDTPRADRWTNGCRSCVARATAALGACAGEEPGKPVSMRLKLIARDLFGNDWKDGLADIQRWARVIRRTDAQTAFRAGKQAAATPVTTTTKGARDGQARAHEEQRPEEVAREEGGRQEGLLI